MTREVRAMSDSCLFCRIVQGEIPSTPVYEDEELFAFRDINPCAPTHVLVVPRRHIARITDADEADTALLGRMLLCANRIAAAEGIAEPGFRYVINCNDHGGQSVYHIHLHVLGGRPLAWPPG
jgi:histidine triad (HIT) family protein